MKFRNYHAGCCGFSPTRSDGTEWSHVLLLHDGSMIHADTPAEVIAELIPGYGALDAAERRTARIGHAQQLAQAAQEARIAAAAAAGVIDLAAPDVVGLLTLLRAARSEPMAFETEDAPGVAAPWLGDPQLVLVTTTYAPHAEIAPVTGNVSWLDPHTEESYLGSLRDTGVFSYWAQSPTS